IFLAFGLLPIVFSAVVSLYDWQGTTPGSFVGFSNYQVLLQDSDFYTSLWNTVWIWLGSVPTMVLLALIFASILNSKTVWFRSLFRTVYFLPVVTSLVITGLVFSLLFSNTVGLINQPLSALGIPTPDWLG